MCDDKDKTFMDSDSASKLEEDKMTERDSEAIKDGEESEYKIDELDPQDSLRSGVEDEVAGSLLPLDTSDDNVDDDAFVVEGTTLLESYSSTSSSEADSDSDESVICHAAVSYTHLTLPTIYSV